MSLTRSYNRFRKSAVLLCIILISFISFSVDADVLHLTNGKTLNGSVELQGYIYTVDIGFGTVEIPAGDDREWENQAPSGI